MRVLLAAIALLALALPGQASAADSLVLLAHGQVTFSAPTSKCPGGQATTQVQVVSTGEMMPDLVRQLSGMRVQRDGDDVVYVISIPSIGRANLLRFKY